VFTVPNLTQTIPFIVNAMPVGATSTQTDRFVIQAQTGNSAVNPPQVFLEGPNNDGFLFTLANQGTRTETFDDSLLTGARIVDVPDVSGTMMVGGRFAVSLTPDAVTASACTEQTFTVAGLAASSAIIVSPPSNLGTHIWISYSRATTTNTLAISFCGDATSGTPPSGTYVVAAL
jgi:hypothetical protein